MCARSSHRTGTQAPAPTSAPPGVRHERCVDTSPHPTGNCVAAPTAAPVPVYATSTAGTARTKYFSICSRVTILGRYLNRSLWILNLDVGISVISFKRRAQISGRCRRDISSVQWQSSFRITGTPSASGGRQSTSPQGTHDTASRAPGGATRTVRELRWTRAARGWRTTRRGRPQPPHEFCKIVVNGGRP